MQLHTGQKARDVPCGGPTLYNQRNCGKQRLYRKAKGYQSYLFLCEKKYVTNKNEFEPIPEVLHQREFC